MKILLEQLKKLFTGMYFIKCNITLLTYISVYYIYYYTYLYLYILSIHITYIISSVSLLSIELLISTIIYTINSSNIFCLLEVWPHNTALNIRVYRHFKEYPYWVKYYSITLSNSSISTPFFQGEMPC